MYKPLWKRFKEERRKLAIEERRGTFRGILREINGWQGNGDIYELDTLWHKVSIEELHNFIIVNVKNLKISSIEPKYEYESYGFFKKRIVMAHFYMEFTDGRIIKVIKKEPHYA